MSYTNELDQFYFFLIVSDPVGVYRYMLSLFSGVFCNICLRLSKISMLQVNHHHSALTQAAL